MTELHTIDLHYLGAPEAIASYIIESSDGPVMIETGPGSSLGALVDGLKAIGHEPGDVKHVLVTHIHFDHAGASGWMAAQGAHVYVHEFGAPHLVNPDKLVTSAKRIYGDDMDRLWGELLPIPEQQVTAVHDGDVMTFGDVAIRAIETPGHARHHHAFATELNGESIAFTGDAAATHIEGCDRFISVPTPPPEFDLETWLASVDRLDEETFDAIYPTHFGRVDDVAGHLRRLRTALREHAAFIRERMDAGIEKAAIRDEYLAWFVGRAEQDEVPLEKMGFYVKDTLADMNVTGIMRYWTKKAEAAAK